MSSGPLLVVLSGPSGVGKDSILARLREMDQPFHYTVTATTRPPRPGERDGHDYYFLAQADFLELRRNAGLLESACVYGKLYGVPKAPILQALAQGADVIMRTNVEGAISIRRELPGAVLIFVRPPALADLSQRLERRQSDSPEQVQRRLAEVQDEMARLREFDYAVENAEGQLDRCVATIAAIVVAEKARVNRPPLGLV